MRSRLTWPDGRVVRLPSRKYLCTWRPARERANGHDTAVRDPAARGRRELAAGAGQAPPLDALHAHERLRGLGGADPGPRRGQLRVRRARQALPGRPVGAVLRERRPRPRGAGRRGRRAVQGARLLHQLELRTPARHRAGRAGRLAGARRPEPGVLHLRRRRGRGVRAQAVPRVAPPERRRPAHQGHRARDRLPRHHPRRALGHGHHRACARRSSRSPRAAATCPTPTATAGPRAAIRCGPPTPSRSGSSSRGRRPCRP